MLNTDYYLFVYDIHESKTISKIVKRLELINSMRIQKSIFEIQGSLSEVEALIKDVEKIVDTQTDKIAIIPLCDKDYVNVRFYGLMSRQPKQLPKYYVL